MRTNSFVSHSMEPSDILRDLCIASNAQSGASNTYRGVPLIKMFLLNSSVFRDESLKGHVLLASSIPKESLAIGVTVLGQIRLDGVRQSKNSIKRRSASPAQSMIKQVQKVRLSSFNRGSQEEMQIKVIPEESKEQMSVSISKQSVNQKGFSDKSIEKGDLAFLAVPSYDASNEGIMNRAESRKSSNSSSVTPPLSELLRRKNHLMPLSMGSAEIDKLSESLGSINPLSITSKQDLMNSTERKKSEGSSCINLFKVDYLLFTFDRAMPKNTPLMIPFEIQLPSNMPYTDEIKFNQNDNIWSGISGFLSCIEEVSIEYSIWPFAQDEFRNEPKSEYERIPIKLDRCSSILHIPDVQVFPLGLNEKELEQPGFFSFLCTNGCSDSKCLLKAKFMDQNELQLLFECKKFESKVVSGFSIMIECQINFGGSCYTIMLWENTYFPEQAKPISHKFSIQKSDLRLIPVLTLPLLRISNHIRVNILTKDANGGNSVLREAGNWPIDFDWFLMKPSMEKFKFKSQSSINLIINEFIKDSIRSVSNSPSQKSIDNNNLSPIVPTPVISNKHFEKNKDTEPVSLPYVKWSLFGNQVGIFK